MLSKASSTTTATKAAPTITGILLLFFLPRLLRLLLRLLCLCLANGRSSPWEAPSPASSLFPSSSCSKSVPSMLPSPNCLSISDISSSHVKYPKKRIPLARFLTHECIQNYSSIYKLLWHLGSRCAGIVPAPA